MPKGSEAKKDDEITLEYIEENLQKCDNPEVEAIVSDLNFVIDRYVRDANTQIQGIMGPTYWLTASMDITVVEVEPIAEGR